MNSIDTKYRDTIVISAGGTGGHIFPALSIIKQIKEYHGVHVLVLKFVEHMVINLIKKQKLILLVVQIKINMHVQFMVHKVAKNMLEINLQYYHIKLQVSIQLIKNVLVKIKIKLSINIFNYILVSML